MHSSLDDHDFDTIGQARGVLSRAVSFWGAIRACGLGKKGPCAQRVYALDPNRKIISMVAIGRLFIAMTLLKKNITIRRKGNHCCDVLHRLARPGHGARIFDLLLVFYVRFNSLLLFFVLQCRFRNIT